MKIYACLFCSLAAALSAIPSLAWAQASIEPLDRIVAIVNEEVITSVELERESRMAIEQLRRQGTALPAQDILHRQLLERMITKRSLLQVAQQTGLRVSDADVDGAIERIAQENKMTPSGLREAVQRDGIPFERFREDVRGEIMLARLREREVESRVAVNDSEIQQFLRSQSSQGQTADEYNIAHILVTVPEQATPEEVRNRRERAETALAQLRQGVDFRQVAASFSDAPDAFQGGTMGWRSAGRLPTIFVEPLKSLKVGQTSELLRSPNGFHILKLVDKRGTDSPIMVTQTHVRHILIRLNEVVGEADARNRLEDIRDRIQNGSDFGELARLHSDDNSAARGGDLGWVSPGDVVPDFEKVMDALQPGQVSAPFKTPFGWHIAQVLERRDQDMAKDRERVAARQAIRQRKSEEQWQDWVRQQRDKSYVEYLLEEK